jgi:hypothetical protein
MKYELKLEEWSTLEQIIDNSIVERYDGDLEYVGEGKHGELHYKPLDEDHIRQLLVDLWGDRLTPGAIEDAFNRLMQDQGDWPHGYCEEVEELHDRAELERLDQLEDELVRNGTLRRE